MNTEEESGKKKRAGDCQMSPVIYKQITKNTEKPCLDLTISLGFSI